MHDSEHLDFVRQYYESTWPDYRRFWLNPENCAIHVGYWDEGTHDHAQSLANMNRALAARIGIRPEHRVLDAGSGIGGSAIWLAKTFGVHVVGIDSIPSYVERARRNARAQGVEDLVTFDRQDYTATTFPAASFDVVWAIESVCHARDKRRFLAEARRLLRPGGRLGVADGFRTRRPHGASNERLLRRWLRDWAVPDLATRDEFVGWTTDSGFDDIRLEEATAHVLPSMSRLFLLSLFCWVGESGLRAMALRSAIQHRNLRGARDQYRALRRGLWFYGILTGTASRTSF